VRFIPTLHSHSLVQAEVPAAVQVDQVEPVEAAVLAEPVAAVARLVPGSP